MSIYPAIFVCLLTPVLSGSCPRNGRQSVFSCAGFFPNCDGNDPGIKTTKKPEASYQFFVNRTKLILVFHGNEHKGMLWVRG